jgi:hypothetical protein
MSTQPSEHAMKFALKYYQEVAAVFNEPLADDDVYVVKFAREIDTHAIEPATRELREQVKELVDAGGLMRAWLGKTDPGITSRWDAVLAKYEEKS